MNPTIRRILETDEILREPREYPQIQDGDDQMTDEDDKNRSEAIPPMQESATEHFERNVDDGRIQKSEGGTGGA